MLNGGMNGAIAIKGGNTMLLSPGGMIRLNDLDNLRVLATKKGLILRAGNNGRRTLKLMWKGGANAQAKGLGTVAKVSGAQGKALASSAKSLAVSADTLAKTAKSMAVPVKATAISAGAAKAAAAGTIWTGTGASLGLGLGLGALGPVLLLGGLGAAVSAAIYFRAQRPVEPPPEY